MIIEYLLELGSQIASGAHTIPAVESSTIGRLSFVQVVKLVESQVRMPRDPKISESAHVVYL